MKLKKGSKEAKAFMAKIRAKRGTTKKVTAKKKIGASFDSGAFKVLGKKNGQLVEISNYPMTYEDAKKFIKNQGIEKYYTNVDIIPYRGTKKTVKYIGAYKKVATKKVGSTLKFSPKETRLGATDKDLKTRSKSYHKDTKSHNVNIRVISGFKKFTKHKGFTIDYVELANGKKEYAVYQLSPITKKEIYYGSYLTLTAAKNFINRSLYLLSQVK